MSTIATETAGLVPEICRSFTQLTGWRLRYTAARRPAAEIQAELENDVSCCWFAPVSDGTRPTGFLHVEPPEPGEDRATYLEATEHAAALANLLSRLASASAQLNLRDKDVSTLINLSLAVPVQDDLAFGLSQLLKAAAHLTGSRSAAFLLLDASASRLKLRAVYELARSDVPCAERELKGHQADLQALAEAPVVVSSPAPGGHPLLPAQMRVGMCAGVQSETVPFGTLWVYDRRNREYSQRDRHVLQSLAAQIAAVLERTALLRGSEVDERINRDLKAASETQCGVTVDDLPEDPRFELAARCTSCYELGGDLCEVISLSPDRVALTVGDASGNSIPAAMIMSAVRGAVRTHAADEPDVPALLHKLNRALCHITHAHQFMSLCYGVYDAARRAFTYTNAGHPTPLLVRGETVQHLVSHGLLLGVVPEVDYDCSVVALEPGDLLVFYSDGISEARSSSEQLFRGEGITTTVQSAGGQSAREVLDSIWNRVEAHMVGGAGGDDRTLLVLKVR